MHRVESFLKTSSLGVSLDRKTRGDIKFHVALHVALTVLGKAIPTIDEVAEMSVRGISDQVLGESANKVLDIYNILVASNPGEANKVAKSPDFRDKIKQDIVKQLQEHSASI